jgi:hypothetical protein
VFICSREHQKLVRFLLPSSLYPGRSDPDRLLCHSYRSSSLTRRSAVSSLSVSLRSVRKRLKTRSGAETRRCSREWRSLLRCRSFSTLERLAFRSVPPSPVGLEKALISSGFTGGHQAPKQGRDYSTRCSTSLGCTSGCTWCVVWPQRRRGRLRCDEVA